MPSFVAFTFLEVVIHLIILVIQVGCFPLIFQHIGFNYVQSCLFIFGLELNFLIRTMLNWQYYQSETTKLSPKEWDSNPYGSGEVLNQVIYYDCKKNNENTAYLFHLHNYFEISSSDKQAQDRTTSLQISNMLQLL